MLWPRKKSKIRLLLLSTRRQPNNVTTDMADTAAMADTVTATVDVVPLRIRTLRSSVMATTEVTADMVATATAAMATVDIAVTTTVEYNLNL